MAFVVKVVVTEKQDRSAGSVIQGVQQQLVHGGNHRRVVSCDPSSAMAGALFATPRRSPPSHRISFTPVAVPESAWQREFSRPLTLTRVSRSWPLESREGSKWTTDQRIQVFDVSAKDDPVVGKGQDRVFDEFRIAVLPVPWRRPTEGRTR